MVRMLLQAAPSWLVLSRDTLRAAIICRPTFSAEEKSLVDGLILEAAGYLLAQGRDVVIDGMALSSADLISRLARAAEAAHAPCRIVECVCSEAAALERITRDAGAHPAGDRGAALYHAVKARYQQISLPFLRIDTEEDAGQNLARILDFIRRSA